MRITASVFAPFAASPETSTEKTFIPEADEFGKPIPEIMKAIYTLILILGAAVAVSAQRIPSSFNYQGRVLDHGLPYGGDGYFRFAIYEESVDQSTGEPAETILWTNRFPASTPLNNPAIASEPDDSMVLPVRNGLFSVCLGNESDPSNPKSPVIGPEIFLNRTGVKLRVWFSPAAEGPFTALQPDIAISSVPYAHVAGVAETVKEGSITNAEIVPGVLTEALKTDLGSILSTDPVNPTLQAQGYVRLQGMASLTGANRYLYEKSTAPVYRMALAKPDGTELVNGQSVNLDSGAIVLTLLNLGNQNLSGLSATLGGADGDNLMAIFSSGPMPPGGTKTLTVRLTKQVYGAAAELTVNATNLPQAFTFPLTVAAPAVPAGFALVPAGSFTMGYVSLDNGDGYMIPHDVAVSGFVMQTKEVSKSQWDTVKAWGATRGYTDLPTKSTTGPTYPVRSSWSDALKWCNARSEMDSLTPCYTVNGQPMRVGTATPDVDWNANGYRLPTEAEWEKAARGGLVGKRFPWGDTISRSQAVYFSSFNDPYDLGGGGGADPVHGISGAPVGSFQPNGYGLYDMAGNVAEWCWDRFSQGYYLTSPKVNPYGPNSISYPETRVVRGGAGNSYANWCRSSFRYGDFLDPWYQHGIRPVRGHP